ncbi:MAG: hypothetical protein ILO53_04085 [Clostridia bacterium]|nr:hypothetical protein [Clostridia bacterium]
MVTYLSFFRNIHAAFLMNSHAIFSLFSGRLPAPPAAEFCRSSRIRCGSCTTIPRKASNKSENREKTRKQAKTLKKQRKSAEKRRISCKFTEKLELMRKNEKRKNAKLPRKEPRRHCEASADGTCARGQPDGRSRTEPDEGPALAGRNRKKSVAIRKKNCYN